MTLDKTFALARKHLNNASARLCLADAVAMRDLGELVSARARALDSLRYSIGVFHADYQRAFKAFEAIRK